MSQKICIKYSLILEDLTLTKRKQINIGVNDSLLTVLSGIY